MSLYAVLSFSRRWWWLLLLGPALAGATAFAIVRVVPPVYEARVMLLVGPGGGDAPGSQVDPDLAEQLGRTYVEVARTRPVLDEAAAKVGFSGSFRDLQQHVSARLIPNTQLIRLAVQDTDPEQASDLANGVADALVTRTVTTQANRFASSRDNLARLVDSLRTDIDTRTRQIEALRAQPSAPARDAEVARLQGELAQLQSTYSASVRSYEELRVVEARGMNTLTIMEPATPPDLPVAPQKPQILALAVLAGLALAAGLGAAADYLDDGLRDRARLARATGLVTLGVVPRGGTADGPAPVDRRLAESYRLLLLNLQVAAANQPLRTLMIASAGLGEGKSLTARNLAAALAEAGRRVVLVDADLHRPTQMQAFGLDNRIGFSTLLLDPDLPLGAALQATAVPSLKVVTAGPTPADSSALFSLKRLDERLAALRREGDLVVLDTPPLLALPDAALLASHVDAVLFVVDATKSRGRAAGRALEMLRDAGAQVVGAVLNRVPRKTMEYAAYSYGAYRSDEARPRRPGATPAAPQVPSGPLPETSR